MSRGKDRPPIGHHMVMRLWDNRVIAATDPQRRTVARCVLTAAQEHVLLAFGLIDTHLHAENAEDWARCGRLAQKIGAAVKRSLRLDVGFAPVYRKPIRDQGHLYGTFYYDLGQQDHHGVNLDPFHEASNLPDLLGLRLLGGYTRRNQEALAPRVRRASLLETLGVAELREDADVPYDGLAEAAAAAACLPDVLSRSREARSAKVAAIAAAQGHLDDAQVGALLNLSRRRVGELGAAGGADQDLVRAIRLQLFVRYIKRADGLAR